MLLSFQTSLEDSVFNEVLWSSHYCLFLDAYKLDFVIIGCHYVQGYSEPLENPFGFIKKKLRGRKMLKNVASNLIISLWLISKILSSVTEKQLMSRQMYGVSNRKITSIYCSNELFITRLLILWWTCQFTRVVWRRRPGYHKHAVRCCFFCFFGHATPNWIIVLAKVAFL